MLPYLMIPKKLCMITLHLPLHLHNKIFTKIPLNPILSINGKIQNLIPTLIILLTLTLCHLIKVNLTHLINTFQNSKYHLLKILELITLSNLSITLVSNLVHSHLKWHNKFSEMFSMKISSK